MTQENRSSRQAEIHITQMRRNPYLVDYQTGKNMGRHMGRRTERSQHSTPAMPQEGTRTRTYPQHSVAPRQENRTHQQKQRTADAVYGENVYKDNTYNTRARHRLARAERQRRRRRARIRRYIRLTLLSAGILVGIIALTKLLNVPAGTAEASTPMEAIDMAQQVEKGIENTIGTRIQGLSAETYAAHPDWTEDSISIECCYKADNGQFTQETYDSLIRLLRWLIDAYELEPEDILRHYDCGGKKCPIYYTEHEDAWDRLKEDVKNL